MTVKPRTLAERVARRKFYLDREMARARYDAATRERSSVCINDQHDRCRSGSPKAIDCLCECHDEAAPR